MPKSPKRNRHNRQLGQGGEDLAAAFLEEHGYRIFTRNYRGGNAEIDIVAARDDTVVFVEVKRRSDTAFGSPALAVNRRKQKQIIRAARSFLAEYRLKNTCFRFDVIAISGNTPDGNGIEHFEGAFTVPPAV